MRIVVHGQQAFGKAVLEALLKRGDDVVARLCRAGEAGAEGRSAQGSGARGEASGPSAGLLPQAGGVGGIPRPQAGPAGDGVRDAVRAGGVPQHPDPRLDPVSPLAAAGLSRRRAPSTGRSSWARRKPACRSSGPTTGSIPATCCCRRRRRSASTDTLGTVYFDRLFPMGVEAMLESVDLVKAGKAPRIKQDEAKATYEGRCGADNAHIDWAQVVAADRSADPRLQSGARRLVHARRQDAQDLRRQAAAGARTPRASPARWARSSRSKPTASPWSAPMAASRSLRVQPADGEKIDGRRIAAAANLATGSAVSDVSRTAKLHHESLARYFKPRNCPDAGLPARQPEIRH